MEYYNLMHKNDEVLTFSRDNDKYSLLNVKDYNLIPIKTINDDKKSLEDKTYDFIHMWLFTRLVPEQRLKNQEIEKAYKCSSPFELIEKVHGLSLSDQYWIKKANEDIKWDKINFFDNIVYDDNYLLFLNENNKDAKDITSDTISPSINLNGEMIKAWVFSDGKYKLIKGKTNDIRIYNEEIASSILNKLGLKHITYNIGEIDGNYYCICDDYINKNTEFLSARTILNMFEFSDDNKLNYENYIDICKRNGLSNVKYDLDNMIIFDYIIGNSDRHLNNFGVVRDANTLKFLELFPIFDNGNILWFHNDEKDELCRMNEITKDWETILYKIDSFNLLNNSFIKEIPEYVSKQYEHYKKYIKIDDKHINDILLKIENRIKNIYEIANKKEKKGIVINYDK